MRKFSDEALKRAKKYKLDKSLEDRHHFAVTDPEVIEIIIDYENYRNIAFGFSQKFRTQGDIVQFCILYCLHNNIIQKEGEK